MKENIEYKLKGSEIRRYFSITEDNGKIIASGDVCINEKELLKVYETNPELAEKDIRLESLLNNPITPEPHQPSNAEVAQMISDLQADLIIAGVI